MVTLRRSATLAAFLCLSSCASTPGEPSPLPAPSSPAAPTFPPAPTATAAVQTASTATPPASPPASPTVVDAAGCVREPRRHGVQFVLEHHASTVAERLGRPPVAGDFEGAQTCLSTATLPDVDGDGVAEVVVSEGCSWGNAAALQLLYFSARGCPRFAGALLNGELAPRAESAGGVRDLEATWSNGCAGGDFAWTHYRWDGEAYRVLDQATCHLCADSDTPRRPPGANNHPQCKAEAKRRGVSLR